MNRVQRAGTVLLAIMNFLALPSFAQLASNAGLAKLPQVQCNTATDGFCDITLAIEHNTMQPDRSLQLTVAGAYKNTRLALQVVIASGMKPGVMNPMTSGPQPYSMQRGGVQWIRSDEAGDRFVARLAELYHTKNKPKKMGSDIHFAAFAFRGDPDKIESREVLFELYHDDPANQVPQCVVLFDVNLPSHEVSIREKNQDFRDCIIRILGETE
jgi:hypothetical protein